MWQHKDILLLNSASPVSASVIAPDSNSNNNNDQSTPLHRVHCGGSVLAIAVSSDHIYAGTQSGDIMIFSTETYDHVRDLKGHSGCILALLLSQDESLLFSSAGDAIINIWRTNKYENVNTIYSTFDIGDIFCVAYSQRLSTLYLGAQNTSIQWYDFRTTETRRKPSLRSHPSRRSHRFFDSLGPGGSASPRPPVDCSDVLESCRESQLVEIDPGNIVQYAHFGYVYCMLLSSFTKDGEEILVSGGGDGSIKLWEIDAATSSISAEKSKSLSSGDCGVLCMATRDQFLYCGLTDGEISIWDLDSQTLIRSIKGHQDDVLTMTVRDKCIWSGSASGYVRKWSQRFELLGRWKAHDGLLLASEVKHIKGKDVYLSGGNDDCVAIWDVSCHEDDLPSLHKTTEDELLSTLRKLVSYRTVANDPTFSEDCRQGASLLKSIFRQFGAQSFLIPTADGRNPIVFARFTPPESTVDSPKQTILFYGHYDVISAGDAANNQWITEPFEMTGMNSYLYGRGVSDNKGPVLAAIFAAGELAQNNLLTSNIVFLIEGEEEAGSRGFKEAVKKYKDFIGPVDWILLANSYWLDDEAPCVTYGLRGVVHASVEICSDRPDLHSGVDGSRESREPVIDMVNLLAKLTSDDGKIMIPGFHESVRPVTHTEETMYAEITNSFANRFFRDSIPAHQLKAHLMSRWRYPSLTIHRVNVSGPTNATIIPRSASAAISLRIVPDQKLATVCDNLTAYLHGQFASFNSPNDLKISIDHVSEWWLGDPLNKAFKTLARAVEEVWEKKPLFIREGGSIPAVRFLEMEFGASAAHLPCGQASDAAHLDNERMRVANLYKSKSIMKKVFVELPLEVA
ncbi:Beta-TrCP [Arthrobotrys entomopaga]|nr:Beta-TrCP [Arthrobotrys entomopaga]